MGFKLLIVCLGLLAVSVTASPLCCKCGPEEKTSVKKYHLKMSKDGQDYDEKIEIDNEKETETFHVPKTSPEEEAADMVYDFKKNMLMIRLPEANSCFLLNSTGNAPRPAELAKLLEKNNNDAVQDDVPQKELKFKKEGSLDDRSELSDEMADLCKKLPIYQVVEKDFTDKVPDADEIPDADEVQDAGQAPDAYKEQAPAQRDKREACYLVEVCGCIEGYRVCHKITRECFTICTRALCRLFVKCE